LIICKPDSVPRQMNGNFSIIYLGPLSPKRSICLPLLPSYLSMPAKRAAWS